MQDFAAEGVGAPLVLRPATVDVDTVTDVTAEGGPNRINALLHATTKELARQASIINEGKDRIQMAEDMLQVNGLEMVAPRNADGSHYVDLSAVNTAVDDSQPEDTQPGEDGTALATSQVIVLRDLWH